MSDTKLEDLFKRAAAIAAVVPEAMQEAAFHRALDALQGTPSQSNEPQARNKKTVSSRKGQPRTDGDGDASDPVVALLNLDRSRAEEVDEEEGGLNKALALMRAAERELAIDGLTSPQIAKVLTDKFRWRVTRQAITQALDHAGRLVDRSRDPRGVARYRLMRAGEEYLDTQAADRGQLSKPGRSPRRAKKTSAKARVTAKSRADDATANPGSRAKATEKGSGRKTAKSRSTTGRRVGPKAAVETLVSEGFFATPQTLGAIQQQLAHQYALRFEVTSLSPTMVRLLRERALTRTRNADGQYEYIAPRA